MENFRIIFRTKIRATATIALISPSAEAPQTCSIVIVFVNQRWFTLFNPAYDLSSSVQYRCPRKSSKIKACETFVKLSTNWSSKLLQQHKRKQDTHIVALATCAETPHSQGDAH